MPNHDYLQQNLKRNRQSLDSIHFTEKVCLKFFWMLMMSSSPTKKKNYL